MARALSYVWWPLLLALSIAGVYYGVLIGEGVIAFNVTYLLLALSIAVLERFFPFEEAWLRDDGQAFVDIAHTLLNKGVAQVIIVFVTFIGIAQLLPEDRVGLWPSDLPIVLQTALALVIAEFGLYWKHRLAHEWPWLWRFHAVHHSVTRLWFLNTGRFHLVDTVTGLMVAMPVLLLLGAPKDVLILVSAITAFIGILTHCNIAVRCGVLNYVFNTPDLHRWHHSKVVAEGNKNYGENLMLFDQLFGSFFLPAMRRPPRDIGISHPMPETFVGQVIAPFTRIPL